MGLWGDPAELVGAAICLASDVSGFTNGRIIRVDAGMPAVL